MSENASSNSSQTEKEKEKVYDWSRFTKRINVKASAETLFNAWATRTGIEKWFLRLSEFTKADGELRKGDEQVQAGDKYKWMWYGYPDTVVENGKILEVNQDRLRFSFGKAGNVTVQLKTEEGESIVELTQENIPEDEKGKTLYHLGCMEGWTFYLANLKSILEGGIDLRNKNEKLQKLSIHEFLRKLFSHLNLLTE